MAYVTLGTSSQLQIKVPTNRSTGWGDVMRTDTFLKIAQHNHSGSGNGAQLGTSSLLADAVTGAKIKLNNDEYLRALDSVASDINILKIDTNDDLYIDPTISKINLKNNTFLTARNAADSADVNLLRLDSSDNVVILADVIDSATSTTLTDNTASPTTCGIITLASNEAVKIEYKIVRSTDVQSGELELEQSNASVVESYIGDDCGITFSLQSDVLSYTSTSTGNNATITYTIVKR